MDKVGLDIVLQTARTRTKTKAKALTRVNIKDQGLDKEKDVVSSNNVSLELVEVSQAILRSNYAIDSLMIQHQGTHMRLHNLPSLCHSPMHKFIIIIITTLFLVSIVIFVNTIPHSSRRRSLSQSKGHQQYGLRYQPSRANVRSSQSTVSQ